MVYRSLVAARRQAFRRAVLAIAGLALAPAAHATSTVAMSTTGTVSYTFPQPPLPATFQQAPQLAQLVAEGKLPPVRQRLPENPVVVEPVDQIGTYGGDWQKLAAAITDIQTGFRLGYEPLVRWDRDGKNVVPGVAHSWQMSDGGRTFTFHLRKGMKWSDGVELTSEDFKFTLDQILSHTGFTAVQLPWLRSEGQLPTVEAPDPYTVIYKFKAPYGNFPRAIAASGLQYNLFGPKHYLLPFHEKFTDPAEMAAMIKKAGFITWVDFFTYKIDPDKNTELPTVAPFITRQSDPNVRVVAERNPYYYKVDTAGNQLPYMDRMVTKMVFDERMLNIKAINGEVDFQIRKIDPTNFTMFKEEGKRKGYRTVVFPSTSPTCIYVSPYSKDEKVRPILADKRFRQALSYAINREELIDLIYTGLSEPSSGFTIPDDTYFLPGMDKANTEFDPEKANALLDELGLKRRKLDGLRELPDGTLFSQLLSIYPSEEGINADMWQLVVDYWREVGLHFATKADDGNLAYLQMTNGNTNFFTYLNASMHWDVDGVWKAPISNLSYLAPAYGNYVKTGGTHGVKPTPDMQQLVDWFAQLRATPDDAERLRLGQNILHQWASECYVVGICRAPVVGVVSNRLKNVPENFNYDYRLKSPGYLGIEQFYLDDTPEAAR